MPSATKVNTRMRTNSPLVPSIVRLLIISCSISRLRKEPKLRKNNPNTLVNVSMPSPPNCRSTRMNACPVRVKSSPVVSTVSPVTQTALVAVNRASTRDISTLADCGRSSSSVPSPINTAKLLTKIRAGCMRRVSIRNSRSMISVRERSKTSRRTSQ